MEHRHEIRIVEMPNHFVSLCRVCGKILDIEYKVNIARRDYDVDFEKIGQEINRDISDTTGKPVGYFVYTSDVNET